jgi:hypothetical protein
VYYIGIDPGKSVGLAVFHGIEMFKVTQATADVVLKELSEVLSSREPIDSYAYIGCERFVSLPRKGYHTNQPDTQTVIGQVTQLVSSHDNLEFSLQSPTDARHLMSAKRMRELRLWITPKQVGQRDANDANMAVRHAMLAMMLHNRNDFKALLATTATLV